MDSSLKEKIEYNHEILEETVRNVVSLIFMSTLDEEDTISALMKEILRSITDALKEIESSGGNQTDYVFTKTILEVSRVEALLRALIDQVEYYLQIIEKNEEKKLLHQLSEVFFSKALETIEALYMAF